jgi:hypothetical protein
MTNFQNQCFAVVNEQSHTWGFKWRELLPIGKVVRVIDASNIDTSGTITIERLDATVFPNGRTTARLRASKFDKL